MNKQKTKRGFSLTELLVSITIMAVLSLLVVFAVTKKTQKTLSAPKSGKLICYKDMEGKLHQKSEIKKQKNGATEIKDEIVTKCVFDIPVSATNAVLYVIGGGGGGAASPTVNPTAGLDSIPLKLDYTSQLLTKNKDGGTLYTNKDSITTLYSDCCNGSCTDKPKTVSSFPIKRFMPLFETPSCSSKDAAGVFCASDLTIFENNTIDEIRKYSDLKNDVCAGAIKIKDALASFYKYFKEETIDDFVKDVFQNNNFYKNLYGRGGEYIYPNTAHLTTRTLSRTVSLSGCTGGNYHFRVPVVTDSTKYCYCKNGDGIECTDQMSNFFVGLTSPKFLLRSSGDIKVVSGINNVSIGSQGQNGTTEPKSLGNAYAGITIKIEKDDIGNGGAIGNKGGDTKFKYGAEDIIATGGNAGAIKLKDINIVKHGELKNDEKLGNGSVLNKNSLEVIPVKEERQNGGLSDYRKDNLGGIADVGKIVLPNSECKENPSKTKGYEITKYDANDNNYYNLNYGGGGGGYFPCIKYDYIASKKVELSKNVFASGGSFNTISKTFDGSSGGPELKYGSSTKGMGGAIIIQWGE